MTHSNRDALLELVDRFDRAAQTWGWEMDQGVGKSVSDAKAEYDESRSALIAALASRPSPVGRDEVDDETEAEIAVAEKRLIVDYLRRQSDIGAEHGLAAHKGTTRRAAYGGGSLALTRAADNIEADEHHAALKSPSSTGGEA